MNRTPNEKRYLALSLKKKKKREKLMLFRLLKSWGVGNLKYLLI